MVSCRRLHSPPAAASSSAAETDGDAIVGGETSSEGEISGDDASEAGETMGSGEVPVASSMAYELQLLMDDGSGAETASEIEQPRRQDAGSGLGRLRDGE